MLATSIAACLSLEATAQSDSSWLDAGNLKLKKAFTQTISIKGEELEKMPFSNLADAINVWLYGAYSNGGTLAYVVDGVPQEDVNVYSIYDIEEVVLVQNALAQLNGASGPRQLVLITTRKKAAGPSGITLAAQSFLVNRNFDPNYPNEHLRSHSDIFQQYYAGVNKSIKNIDFGLSANYLRDVMPVIKADSIKVLTPDQLSRYRLNGYLNLKLGGRNVMTLRVNYASQTIDSAQQYYFGSPSTYAEYQYAHAHQHHYVFTPSLTWRSEFSASGVNELQAVWVGSADKENNIERGADSLPRLYTSSWGSMQNNYQRTNQLVLRDNLAFSFHWGRWHVVPSLNLSYAKTTDSVQTNLSSFFTSINNPPFQYGPFESPANSGLHNVFTLYSMIPSLNLYWGNAFDVQGGVQTGSILFRGQTYNRTNAFFNFAVDLLKFHDGNNPSALKLFVSYAKAPEINMNDYALTGLGEKDGFSYTIPGTIGGTAFPFNLPYAGPFLYGGFIEVPNRQYYWAGEAGIHLSTPGGKFQMDYNFERRDYLDFLFPYHGLYITSGVYVQNMRTTLDHVGISARIIDDKDISWLSSLNLTCIKLDFFLQSPPDETGTPSGDLGNGNPSWTGGWANRWHFRNFSAGLDILYHFNEAYNFYLFSTTVKRQNNLLLQNIYLSYRLSLTRGRVLELSLESRNLSQNSSSDLTDERRFYGIGAKVGI